MGARWTEDDLRAFQTRSKGASSHSPKSGKHRNKRTVDAEGRIHDSKKEAARWQVLQERARLGVISDLHRQVVFDLVVNGLKVCTYIADACYRDEQGRFVCEDTKGSISQASAISRLKFKLMKACHGIDVTIFE